MTIIAFNIIGNPVTQGSKSAFMAGGRAYLREAGGAKHKDWRYAVADEARRWMEQSGDGLFIGPVIVRLRFTMIRPASHPKKRRTWPIGARSGDVDKLARSVLDSLTGTLIVDDAQVVGLSVTKDYGDPPGVHVQVLASPLAPIGVFATSGWSVQSVDNDNVDGSFAGVR